MIYARERADAYRELAAANRDKAKAYAKLDMPDLSELMADEAEQDEASAAKWDTRADEKEQAEAEMAKYKREEA